MMQSLGVLLTYLYLCRHIFKVNPLSGLRVSTEWTDKTTALG